MLQIKREGNRFKVTRSNEGAAATGFYTRDVIKIIETVAGFLREELHGKTNTKASAKKPAKVKPN